MSCNLHFEMENQLDSTDQLLAEEGFEQEKILENFVDFLYEKEFSNPESVSSQICQQHSYPQRNQSSYSSTSFGSSEFFNDAAVSPSSNNSFCSRPESAYSSTSSESWYPSDCPPSTSSSTTSSDLNVFNFSPKSESITAERPKRVVRRTRYAPPKSPLQQATRGRGRPMKDNTEGDQTVIRKRIYAREYRKKNQKTHDELFSCLLDFYTVITNKGIDVSQLFPQHKKVISEIVKAL